jgi:hypothetical protein
MDLVMRNIFTRGTVAAALAAAPEASIQAAGDGTPAGAVQWYKNHAGIADGSGGFYASSVGGAIGHGSSVSYFNNYRGWTPAAVPHQ